MNIFTYSAREQQWFTEMEMNEFGYETISTFFGDLSIAELFGVKAIKDTYQSVTKEWISDYKMYTEFVLCLNHKSWEWSARGKDEFTELYADLFYKSRDAFYKYHSKNEEATSYFFNMTD